MILAVY